MPRDRSRSRDRERRDRSRERDRDRGDRDRGDRDKGERDRGDRDKGDRDRGDRDKGREDRDKGDRDRRESGAKPPADDHVDDDVFRPGRSVIVKGLQKNPEKNGSIGKLLEFNKEKGRWAVEFSAGNNNFKEENLELMPDNSDVINDDEEPPTAKIYITNLAADVTDKDLLALFGGCGVVAKEKPKSGRDRGFEDQWPYAVKVYKPGKEGGDASLTFQDPHAAKAAIKTYNRYKWKGNKIGVSYAGQGQTYEKVELQKPWYLREENMGKMEGGSSGGKPGDWVCSCGATVYASKDSCFKCGQPRLRNWTCPQCGGDVNASKVNCFACGAPKPGTEGGDMGESSGGGGGGKGGGYGKDEGKDGGKGKGMKDYGDFGGGGKGKDGKGKDKGKGKGKW